MVEHVTNARHRKMLKVILGETLEQQRFFEQAAAGADDLLGRRAGTERVGAVAPRAGSMASDDGQRRATSPVAIALGSNLGDRARISTAAVGACAGS